MHVPEGYAPPGGAPRYRLRREAASRSAKSRRVSRSLIRIGEGREAGSLIFLGQSTDDFIHLAEQHAVDLVKRKIDAVIGDTALRKIEGADALAAIPRADLAAAIGRARRMQAGALLLVKPGTQDLHGLGAVLVLASLFLHRDHDAARNMRDPDRAFRLVDVLAAGTGGPIYIDAQIAFVDL